MLKKLRIGSFLLIFLHNKLVTIIIVIYILLMLSIINWGNPNLNHPYNYHMDEWHQFMAVKSLYQHGTPNVEGAAHGTVFQFILSGIYLVPFIMLHIIHIGLLKVSLVEQNTLFIILRINTLLFGILSLIVIALFLLQFLEAVSWVAIKWPADTRQSSSLWI
jgi:hypothetical protein